MAIVCYFKNVFSKNIFFTTTINIVGPTPLSRIVLINYVEKIKPLQSLLRNQVEKFVRFLTSAPARTTNFTPLKFRWTVALVMNNVKLMRLFSRYIEHVMKM